MYTLTEINFLAKSSLSGLIEGKEFVYWKLSAADNLT
jgi:hypothetical protein